jgi:transglutaminase-like putative cysteine protease
VPIARIPRRSSTTSIPSRYCQSDRLQRIASREFGHLRPGYWRVLAIRDWVRARTVFTPGSTNSSTSAVDTLVEQVGVCRDYAHLMIALCRALNIPARFATSIDYGAAVELGLPDFHALCRGLPRRSLVRLRPHRDHGADGTRAHRHGARRRPTFGSPRCSAP